MAELEQDPDYQRRQEEIRQRQQRNYEEYMTAAAPVFAELADVGVLVDRLDAEQLMYQDYRAAIPVLVRWLPRAHPRIKDSLVRALSVPYAKRIAAPALIAEFRSAPPEPPGYKWTVGYAVSVVADDSVFDDIVSLALDKSQGPPRSLVVDALANMRNPGAVDVLTELLADDEVVGHAVCALGKLKAVRVRPLIEPILDHPDSGVRKQAQRALAKIDRAAAKPPRR
jgi:HEAT repeat protein